jgi:hypothetical protein
MPKADKTSSTPNITEVFIAPELVRIKIAEPFVSADERGNDGADHGKRNGHFQRDLP